jgi:hypothetical protein
VGHGDLAGFEQGEGVQQVVEAWIARLQTRAGRIPCLHVQNPEPGAGALAENIYAAPKGDSWWFWWSWAEPIAQDITATAAILRRTLRTAARKDTPA